MQTPRSGSERPYVAVYGHNFPASFRQAVRHWAASRGYRLVSIGYRNDWADEQNITAGPEDFARIMAQSAAVATNFFNGCVFALLNARSEEHTSGLQSLMRITYAVFCLKKKTTHTPDDVITN